MIDDAEGMQHLLSDIELAIQSELRVQRLDSAIVVCRDIPDSLNLIDIFHSGFSSIL